MRSAIILCFIGCNNPAGNNQPGDVVSPADSTEAIGDANVSARTAAATACYTYLQNGDTIRLKMTTSGNTFAGSLLYQLKEKDRNKGNLQGTIYGDTLVGEYTFSSEGMQSNTPGSIYKTAKQFKRRIW